MEEVITIISTAECFLAGVRVVANTEGRTGKVLQTFKKCLRPECAACLGDRPCALMEKDVPGLTIVGGEDPGHFRRFDLRTGKYE